MPGPRYKKLSDRELLALIRPKSGAEDKIALEELLRRYEPLIRATVHRVAGSFQFTREDLEDLASHLLMETMRLIRTKWDPERGALGTLLKKALRREAWHWVRKQWRGVEGAEQAKVEAAGASGADSEEVALALALCEQIEADLREESWRQVFRLHILGLERSDIAEQLGMEDIQVRNILYRYVRPAIRKHAGRNGKRPKQGGNSR